MKNIVSFLSEISSWQQIAYFTVNLNKMCGKKNFLQLPEYSTVCLTAVNAEGGKYKIRKMAIAQYRKVVFFLSSISKEFR